MKKLYYSIFMFTLLSAVPRELWSQEAVDSKYNSSRRNKAREYCDLNPLEVRCKKYLDSEYRLFKDLEREEGKRNIAERYSKERYAKEKQLEILTFCRRDPSSSRCAALTQ